MKFSGIDNRLLNLYLNSTTEGIFIINKDKEMVFFNARYLELVGGKRSCCKGSIPTSISDGWHDPGFYERMWEAVIRDGVWEDEVWDTNKSTNNLYVMNQKILPYRNSNGTTYLGIITDITTKLKTLRELDYLEKIDQRTNVANRFFGEKKLTDFLNEQKGDVAVILLDVNNYSLIPETFGHLQGDSVLKEIANRIRKSIKSENLFSFVQDRFVIYFTFNDTDEIESKAFEMIEEFHEPFSIEGNEFFLSVNLGISLYRDDGIETELLIKNADSAMHESRKEEFNTFCFYESKMNEAVLEQFQLISDLRKSMERKELSMVYQPQVNCITGKAVGSEALIRWNSASRGNVSPNEFIPLAESKGLITPIGEWVLRNSFNQFQEWENNNNIKDTSMAINISGVQFNDKRLLPLIRNIFYNKVDTSLIELEITESAFVDDIEHSIKTMYKLKDMGFSLAIDDFGTGFSSLSYLKRFPIDKLKIDKSFVDNILTDPGDIAIIKTIISLAGYLDIKVLAEGVESIYQRDLLRTLGCPLIQGFYYSKPLSGDDFINFHNELNNI